jgi:pantetheine-phosphate adenylyltransferase
VRDYEYELEMAWANRGLAPEVETVFLAPSPQVALVSSSLVREVASLGGDVSAWVPPAVVAALAKRPPAGPGSDGARKEE